MPLARRGCARALAPWSIAAGLWRAACVVDRRRARTRAGHDRGAAAAGDLARRVHLLARARGRGAHRSAREHGGGDAPRAVPPGSRIVADTAPGACGTGGQRPGARWRMVAPPPGADRQLRPDRHPLRVDRRSPRGGGGATALGAGGRAHGLGALLWHPHVAVGRWPTDRRGARSRLAAFPGAARAGARAGSAEAAAGACRDRGNQPTPGGRAAGCPQGRAGPRRGLDPGGDGPGHRHARAVGCAAAPG